MKRDDALAKVVISNRFASAREVAEVRDWGAKHHPTKDLAELLFMRGIIDRGKVGLVRRVAKMSRSGKLKRPQAGGETLELDSGASSEDVRGQETQDLPPEKLDEARKREARKRKGRAPDPDFVGRYEIIGRVAAGGMGIVYKARHPELDRIFAVKVLTPRTQASSEAIERFKREAKLAARLDHPHIVRVYDAGTDDSGAPYLVMDYVDGADVGTLLKEEGIGVRKAAQIARKVALALAHAHERGMVHRDVKPDNILIDRETGEPKMTDFGIVKELKAEDETAAGRLTRTGYTLGSPCYMSPEQAGGKHDLVGPVSDVYSLAATLYEMLTGAPPFEGDSIHAIMVQVMRADPVPPRRKNQSIPPDLEVICLKGLEKEPAGRYPSALELSAELDRYLEGEPIQAKPVGPLAKAWRLARRHRAVSSLLATLVLVLLSSGLWAWSNDRERRREAAAQLAAVFDDAVREIDAAGETDDDDETRRHYYEAIRHLDWVLLEDPDHEAARERKKEIVLALGDHLIESGEASFAEFVFSLGTGFVDEAVISSRVEAARLRSWTEGAAEYERAGDLREALRLYRRGLQELRRSGYGGDHVAARIAALEAALDAQATEGQVQQLRALAQGAATKGDHAAAYHTYRRALEVTPDDAELRGKVAYHREKASERVARVEAQVEAQRGTVQTAWGQGREPSPALADHYARAAALGEQADAQLARDDFAGAQRKHEQALSLLEGAYALANADRARERAEAAARQAETEGAEKFAIRQVGAARKLLAQAQAAFQRAAYDESAALYDRAQEGFRQALLTSSGKANVSTAREAALAARAQAADQLTPDHRPQLYDDAQRELTQAEARYNAEDYETARRQYERAAAGFAEVAKLAPDLRQAFTLRARARELAEACRTHQAATFAKDAYDDGARQLADGEAALARNQPAQAAEEFRRATYRLQRALEQSQPLSEGMRECEALRERVGQLKQQVEDAELEWKSGYDSALEDIQAGDEFCAEGRNYARASSWKLAKRRYLKAIDALEKIID